MRFGFCSLGDHLTDPISGVRQTQAERHRSIVEFCVAAEEAGFWSVNLGEHHFCDYILATPPVVLAAVAERTERIRLSTGVTLLANDDPVRVAEDYGTVDLLSDGRVEVVCGRGNLFAHTFGGFGQSWEDSRVLYDEHVEMLIRLWTEESPEWESGLQRPAFKGLQVKPMPLQTPPPIWIGGMAPDSLELAVRFELPLMLPGVFIPLRVLKEGAERYRELWAQAGHDPDQCEIGIISHYTVRLDSDDAKTQWRPRFEHYYNWVRSLVKDSTPSIYHTMRDFDYDWLLRDPAIGGSPAEVVDRIGSFHEELGTEVHLLMMDMGGTPPDDVLAMIELTGQEVIPQLS